jgi:serine/threonine-protein kinase
VSRVLDDRYELGALIGRGGMAEVYEAQDRRLQRPVAVKILPVGVADPQARARFEREARVAAGFHHPNAVTVFDVGDDGTSPYIVMELIDGRSVAQVLAEQGRFARDPAVAIIDQVLAALAAAHAEGFVHRDVKPSNILLAADGTVKLADFGIAKAVLDATEGITRTGEMMGTPKYLSPEQVSGQAATPRSDLYSVGVVLYEMLAGVAPFAGETSVATAVAHLQQPVPSLAARRPDLDPGLVAVVERALEKDPADRFPDAGAMRSALVQHVDSPTVPLDAASTGPTTALTSEIVPEPTALAEPVTPNGRRGARGVVVAGVVAGALAAGALALALLGGDGSDPNRATAAPSTVPTSTVPSSTVPSTTARATTTLPSTTTPPATTVPVTTIDGLIARLGSNPAAYGKKGPELLALLQDVQAAQAKDAGKSAEGAAKKALKDIDEWISHGELDPTIGAQAQQLLQPLTG